MQLIQRVRRMGITSHIRVNLGLAVLVESVALAGLRNDLNAIDGAQPGRNSRCTAQFAGVSLDLNPFRDAPSSALRPLDLSADFSASIDATGTRPSTFYSDDELLAEIPLVFGMMDNPADGPDAQFRHLHRNRPRNQPPRRWPRTSAARWAPIPSCANSTGT